MAFRSPTPDPGIVVSDDHRDSEATLYSSDLADPQKTSTKTDPRGHSISTSLPNRRHQSISAVSEIPALPFHTAPRSSVNVTRDGMPTAVDETDVDPKPDIFTPGQRRTQRGVLAHVFNHEGMTRFPEDKFEEAGEEEDVHHRAPPRRAGSIGSDILPLESPIGDLWTRVMEEKRLARIKGRGSGKEPKDIEFNRVARLPYKLRWKEQKQPVIEHQITC